MQLSIFEQTAISNYAPKTSTHIQQLGNIYSLLKNALHKEQAYLVRNNPLLPTTYRYIQNTSIVYLQAVKGELISARESLRLSGQAGLLIGSTKDYLHWCSAMLSIIYQIKE